MIFKVKKNKIKNKKKHELSKCRMLSYMEGDKKKKKKMSRTPLKLNSSKIG